VANAGVISLTIIGKTLNHRNLKTTEIYARLDRGVLRAPFEANAEAMLRLTNRFESTALAK